MKKVIIFGGTGNLGKEVAKELIVQQYHLTVVVRDKSKASSLSQLASNVIVADVTRKETLAGICTGHQIVISCLGKSVSPNDRSKASFHEVDFIGNQNILEQAVSGGVEKFVYVSAFHAERYPHLDYFNVHHNFSESLKQSGIDYSIIKPPALFSAFTEMIELARKGFLLNIGKGGKKTNPIFEGDLAKVCVDSIHKVNATIEVGGKAIYTRAELNSIVQREANPGRRVRTLPLSVFKAMLPVIKIFDRNTFDKLAFFAEVVQHDTIAPPVGEMRFEEYIKRKVHEQGSSR